MSVGIDKLASELQKVIEEKDKNKKSPYDTEAEVVRVDSDVVWVKIPGGVDETPAQKTVNAKEGDKVQVRVSGGRAFLVGNGTNPPTDDTVANVAIDNARDANQNATAAGLAAEQAIDSANTANEAAAKAQTDAGIAHTAATEAKADAADAKTAATEAKEDAGIAHTAATEAKADAADAKTSANEAKEDAAAASTAATEAKNDAAKANTAANDSLSQLSIVEDVVGTLNWITTHATYKASADTEVHAGKWYFTKSGNTYNVVTNPAGNPSAKGYYEVDTIDEAVSNYVASHIALTSDGLYLTKDGNGYKILLANDGLKVYDPEGHLVSTFGESIIFDSARPQTIGNNNVYIKYYDKNNDGTPDSLAIKADEFLLSSGKTIQEELEGVENWFYSVAPTTSNPPASSWTTDKLKEQHLRDIYFDTTSGKSYRWAKEGTTYKWVEIEDVELAALAKDLHDNYPPRSEFTVAPNKIQSTVSAAQTAATNAANTATDNKLKSYSTTTQMNSAIEQKAGEITASVSSTYETKSDATSKLNTAKGYTDSEITSAKAEIKVTTDGISTEVSKKTDKSTIISTIRQSAETVKIKASQVEIDGTATFNAIKASADAAYDAKGAASAVQTNLDNLTIGGRNLIKYTKDYSGWAFNPKSGSYALSNLEDIPTNVMVFPSSSGMSSSTYQYILGGVSSAGIANRIKYSIIRNQDVVFSFKCKIASGDIAVILPQYEVYSAETGGTRSKYANTKFIVTGTGSWEKYSWKLHAEDSAFNKGSGTVDDTCWIRPSIWRSIDASDTDKTAEFQIKEIKIEIGNKATDWTPAPEDVQAEIDAKKSVHTLDTNYSYTYANILTYSAEGYGGTAGANWVVSSTEGVKQGDTVRLKVTVSDMNNTPVYIIGTVVSVTSATVLKAISHGLDTTVIDGGKILTNSIGANQIKANSLTIGKIATADQDKILNSSIEIGGRNLHKNSNTLDDGWVEDGGTTVSDDGIATIPLAGSGNHRIYQTPANGYWGIWEANTTYTVSVDAKTDTAGLKLSLEPYANGVSAKTFELTTEWKRYSYTFTSGNATSTSSCSYFARNGTSGNVFIRYPKLEKGNKATDWTPAPEDFDDSVARLDVALDGIQADVSAVEQDADNRIRAAEASLDLKINRVASTGDLISNINAVADQISLAASQITIGNNTVKGNLDNLNTAVLIDTKNNTVTVGGLDNAHIVMDASEGVVLYAADGTKLGKYGSTAQIGDENSFHINIDGGELSFYQDKTTRVAYINTKTLFINQAQINDSLRIGQFRWQVKSANRIALVYSPEE